MNIGIAYANKIDQVWMKIEVPDDSNVKEAIELSGILLRFPDINLKKTKSGHLRQDGQTQYHFKRRR
jgi:putative ubiquitin-RnfH superfamily antitoxin RatB of RatAB toxin-antitoxin module